MSVPTTPPKTSQVSWASLVRKAEGDNWHKKDPAYKFSGGRVFKQPSDGGAIYNGSST